MSPVESRVLTAQVPEPLAARVDSLAKRMERSSGWVVTQALAAWVVHQEDSENAAPRNRTGAKANE
jgi:predicted transcriptional regulator